ncbi:hypothetical protein [Wielerella bovis]|nr:hypothetical protein [Wielerella bovis]
MISVGRAFMPDIDESRRIVSDMNARPTTSKKLSCTVRQPESFW